MPFPTRWGTLQSALSALRALGDVRGLVRRPLPRTSYAWLVSLRSPHFANTQERKAEAITCGAPRVLTRLLASPPGGSADVKRLSADALASISALLTGRAAMAAAGATQPMTAALLDLAPAVRLSAVALCEAFSRSPDGAAAALADGESRFVQRLADAAEAADSPAAVRSAALRTLGNVAGFAGGLSAVLESGRACGAALCALERCDRSADAELMARAHGFSISHQGERDPGKLSRSLRCAVCRAGR